MKNKSLQNITEGAMMIALSLVLNLLRLPADWLGGTGGSVELTMLPLMVYALRRGWLRGCAAGVLFGTLKCIIGGGIAYGWASLLLDYAAAFGVTGVAGLCKKSPAAGALAGSLCRWAVHVLSGVILWGAWMPDMFLGHAMSNIWIYSLLYNGVYMAANTILAVVVIYLLAKKTRILSVDIEKN